MQKIWIFLILLWLPLVTFASVEFFALLPNPAWDDTLWEYIKIRNTGCQTVDIWGYHLYDASLKNYTIPIGTSIWSHSDRSFPYSETKISLNNSGIETITLTSTTGSIVDSETYSGTQRDNVVIYLTPVDEDCNIPLPVESNTGMTNTGMSSTGSQDNSSTGGTNTGTIYTGSWAPETSGRQGTGTTDIWTTNTGITNTGTTDSGSTNTGTSSTGAITGTGSMGTGAVYPGAISTGTTDTGSMSIGSIQDPNISSIDHSNTWIVFPNIFPTRQEPTNAILSWNIWDCGMNQPCRVNVTFDPIFTGGLLAKNYLCEVITATGTLTTCNPNILYFSTDSSFSFRLVNKSDPSQSRTVTWGISFIARQDNSLTGSISSTGGVIDTGVTNTGTTSSSSGITFPEIVPTFQNYTNTTQSGDILTCTTSPCRVNFTLDPIFTGSFLAKNYSCEIRYGTLVYDSCNPAQLYPIGTGSIEIVLTHRASWQKESKTIEVIQSFPVPISPTSWVVWITPSLPDTNPPIAIPEFDGKMHSYYEQIDTYEFNCYTLTCSVNLSADRSYDPEWGKVRFLWYYGPNDIRITRDPGGRKYAIWDHEIWLRVIDIAGNVAEIRYRIHVLGPRDKEEQVKTKKIKDPSITKTKESSKKPKKKKPKKMDFFDPPMIALQKSKFIFSDDRYICKTTTKTCSLNLTLSGTEKGIIYIWTYDDGEVISSKNPKSKKLSIGFHEITVAAAYSGSTDILWTRILSVEVDKIKKAKKSKKIKTKKAPKTEIKKEIKPTLVSLPETEQISEDDIPYTTIALLWGIIPLALLRRFLTGVI